MSTADVQNGMARAGNTVKVSDENSPGVGVDELGDPARIEGAGLAVNISEDGCSTRTYDHVDYVCDGIGRHEHALTRLDQGFERQVDPQSGLRHADGIRDLEAVTEALFEELDVVAPSHPAGEDIAEHRIVTLGPSMNSITGVWGGNNGHHQVWS